VLPYGRQDVDESDIEAVAAVMRGDWLTTGPTVAAFEAALGEVGGAPAVSVTSGTAALHVAYAAAGVGPGDVVITTPMTFASTATTAMQLGATIVFADIEDDTANLDPQAVSAVITDETKVITAVDYAGHPADMDALRSVAAPTGALLIEDAAHSIGSRLDGRPVGSIADFTCFSFFPTKNMTTAEGGAVASPDPDLLQAARDFRTIGVVRDSRLRVTDEGPWWYEVQSVGLNYRLPDVLCAMGLSQLKRLEAFKARRWEIVRRYDEALRDVPGVRVPVWREGADPCWHLYALRILDGRRREVFESMRANGIGVQVNYIPVHWQPVFADLGYKRGQFPVAEAFYSEQLSMPLWPGLTDADVDRSIETLIRALA